MVAGERRHLIALRGEGGRRCRPNRRRPAVKACRRLKTNFLQAGAEFVVFQKLAAVLVQQLAKIVTSKEDTPNGFCGAQDKPRPAPRFSKSNEDVLGITEKGDVASALKLKRWRQRAIPRKGRVSDRDAVIDLVTAGQSHVGRVKKRRVRAKNELRRTGRLRLENLLSAKAVVARVSTAGSGQGCSVRGHTGALGPNRAGKEAGLLD